MYLAQTAQLSLDFCHISSALAMSLMAPMLDSTGLGEKEGARPHLRMGGGRGAKDNGEMVREYNRQVLAMSVEALPSPSKNCLSLPASH